MAEKMLVTVEWSGGFSIVRSVSIKRAEAFMRCEHGDYNGPYNARLATDDDIAYFKAMGGHIYDA